MPTPQGPPSDSSDTGNPPPASSIVPRPTCAVILAGGGGLRANPRSKLKNKCLFAVHDLSTIENQICIIRDQLGITDIIVVVGHLKEQIQEKLGGGESLDVSIRYVEVEDVDQGPASGLLQARPLLTGPAFVLLGDEYHPESKHGRLLDALQGEPDLLLTYTRTNNPHQILANFSIEVDQEGAVRSMQEKPKEILNDLCGCGTLYVTPKFLDALEKAEPSARSSRVELFEVAGSFVAEGRVLGVDLDDPGYANINTLEDLHRAKFTYRTRNFSRFTISIVIPAWNEASSVQYVIKDFLTQPQVSEILVMDNFSEDGTAELASEAGARVIQGRFEGYGDAVHAGLDAAEGDILVVVEADYSFRAADLPKLLEYLKDADAVIGTRTTRQLIAQAANMSFMQRIANVALAKYLELIWLWLEPRFTDVGCSYRTIWRSEWESVRDRITCKGPAFTVEMMIELVKARKRCIEIPVSYHPRYGGESKHCQTFWGLARTGLAMAWMITSRWIQDLLKMASVWASREAGK